MTSLLKARWPVFEFSIFLVVALIGWAEYQLYRTVKPQVLETQKGLQREIQDEYFSIADAVVTNIEQLSTALNSLNDPTIFRGRLVPGKEPPEVTRFDE